MSAIKQPIIDWIESLKAFHIPRWSELPEMELYSDQVVSYIEKYLSDLFGNENTFITASMIHNYVKLKLMPKPVKKRYNRMHIAYLITITILKQVLSISEVKDGILRVNNLTFSTSYDLFCDELEFAIEAMYSEIFSIQYEKRKIEIDSISVRMAAYAFVSKMIAQNSIKIQLESNRIEKNESYYLED